VAHGWWCVLASRKEHTAFVWWVPILLPINHVGSETRQQVAARDSLDLTVPLLGGLSCELNWWMFVGAVSLLPLHSLQ
jgi:hypothetical protein